MFILSSDNLISEKYFGGRKSIKIADKNENFFHILTNMFTKRDTRQMCEYCKYTNRKCLAILQQ